MIFCIHSLDWCTGFSPPGIAIDGDVPLGKGEGDALHNSLALIKRKGKVQALVEEIASESLFHMMYMHNIHVIGYEI